MRVRLGGWPGSAIRARVVADKGWPDNVVLRFQSAIDALREGNEGIGTALSELDDVGGLGPSFASKHLRFLRPEVCPVLDSTIWRHLGFAQNPAGYRRFSDYCLTIADRLQEEKVENPMWQGDGGRRGEHRWYAADVEMGIYACLQRW